MNRNQKHLFTKFTELALQAYMQITRFEIIQNNIIDIITDSHHGRLSSELLPPKELQEELRTIEKYNKRDSKLPMDIENITQYYRIMRISHQITKNHIIFNVQIPLTKAKQFELLSLTAIPWVANNTFVKLKLSTNYLIIDLLREDQSQKELSGSGVMNIEDGCIIKTTQVTIEGHGTKTRQVIYIPTSNISQQDLKFEHDNYNFSTLYYNSYKEINGLQDEVHRLKTISLSQFRSHDIHQYGLGYTVLFLVVGCICCITAILVKLGLKDRLLHPRAAPRTHVSTKAPADDAESQMISMYDR